MDCKPHSDSEEAHVTAPPKQTDNEDITMQNNKESENTSNMDASTSSVCVSTTGILGVSQLPEEVPSSTQMDLVLENKTEQTEPADMSSLPSDNDKSDSHCAEIASSKDNMVVDNSATENKFSNFHLTASCQLAKVSESIVGQENSGCLKGCKWAPDGTCLLTNSDDNILRIYNLPETFYTCENWMANPRALASHDHVWNPVLKIKEGGQVYDYCWFPLMNSSDPVSSCLLTAVSNAPVHLWDAFTGSLRASYCSFNQVDELVCPHSIAFNHDGQNIYCGFLNELRIFDIGRPGRQCISRKLKKSSNIPGLSLNGIISTIAVNPAMSSLYALGSYRSSIGLFTEDGTLICALEGHHGGVTQIMFSHDGMKLVSGARKDNKLICWDLRNMGDAYEVFDRAVDTNQRIYFDLTRDDKYLISGGTDGFVRVWDLTKTENAEKIRHCDFRYSCSSDCVNGVSINSAIPVLATSTGQRHFDKISDYSDSDSGSSEEEFVSLSPGRISEFNVKLWAVDNADNLQ